MPVIDFHCDTVYEIHHGQKEQNLYENDLKVDIVKLQKSNVMAQVFALFFDLEEVKKQSKTPLQYAYEMKQTFDDQINQYSSYIHKAYNYEDIVKNHKENKVSALLSIEEGGVLEGKLTNLKTIYEWGVRLLTLTWNYPNEIGFPHSREGGLTYFGQEIVQYMNELGMLIDVSHLSDEGVWDVLSISKQPILASHSNSRSVCAHSRNLTDEMIREIANRGGLIGINLYGLFLGNESYSNIDDVIKHINHIHQVGGIESIALGGDFDGFIGEIEVYNAGEWAKLIDRLKKNNMSDQQIDKITYKNGLRLIKDVL